ncbi:MAG: hypothetical protein AAF984_01390 [Verrucomicrobiota bacterium]
MKISYKLSKLDYIKFQLIHNFTDWRLLGLHILVIAYIAYTIFKPDPDVDLNIIIRLTSLIIISVFYLCVVAAIITVLFSVYAISPSNRPVITKHELEIANDDLIETTEYNISKHKLSSINRIVDRFGLLMIYISTLHAHVIPIKSFSSSEELRKFKNKLEQDKVRR